jgi:hypothetical protein
MNIVKFYVLLMCLGAVIGAQAMMRKTGSQSPITPCSRCQSPLSPSSCRSPQSTKSDSAAVIAYIAMIEAQRIKIEQSIDEKNYQLRMLQRSAYYDVDGEGAGIFSASSAKILKEIEDLRKQLSR